MKSGVQGDNTAGTLIGKSGKDIIFGNNGDDIIVGGGNDDVLNGGKGDDIIFGGKGNDILNGGAGNDIFVIAPNNGFDIIKDFRQGDLIGLDKSLQFSDLTILNQAKGTLVKSGNEKLAFLQGVHQLSAGDFTQVDISNLNSRVHNDFAALSKAA
jgi:Ca2+-binding RTX toxin-like protein